ncbi:T9SS type A sorting domain-containing protein [Kordia sp.]|uniref:T9SS type A sorting domain-containing protein n=1 Tax=Kordia sp. TaxID=1965332 RepID=UPI003B5B00E8
MKKTLFLITLFLCSYATKAQMINELPTSPSNIKHFFELYATNPSEVNDDLVVTRVEDVITNALDSQYEASLADKDISVYYARRVQSHILLYYYYNYKNNDQKKQDHLDYLIHYFNLLLNKQCISYATEDYCATEHGGFPSPANNDTEANPRTTAIALEAFLETKKFLKNVCEAEDLIDIDEVEFEDRIQQATDVLLSYEEYNNQYFNLTAFGFITASKHVKAYNDTPSKDFLSYNADVLFNNKYPLRPASNVGQYTPIWQYNDPIWTYSWDEGFQEDGSWKDLERDCTVAQATTHSTCPRVYVDFNRWHDAEADYHSAILEGLSYLSLYLEDATLKEDAKTKIIAGINHVINYNGKHLGLENTSFLSEFVDVVGYPAGLAQTRFTAKGKFAKYHRETSDYAGILENTMYPDNDPNTKPIKKTVVGVGLLRSLLIAKKALRSSNLIAEDFTRIDHIIAGMVHGILDGGDTNFREAQLYDLALYLNRDAIDGNFPGTQYTNDKLVVSFENETIRAFHEDDDAPNNMVVVDNFYTARQEAYKMAAGDFDGDGNDEAAISFEHGYIYRYEENDQGRLFTEERIYEGVQNTVAMETGDFNDNGRDELIVAFDNGEIRRYETNNSDEFMLLDAFYLPNSDIPQKMKRIDFNGDGKDELFIVSSNVFNNTILRKYHINNSGNFTATLHGVPYSANDKILAIESGDFDTHAGEELIISFDNQETKRYKEQPTIMNEVILNDKLVSDLQSGDFNGDAKDELIIAFNDKTIWRYKENSLGVLTTSANERFYSNNQFTKAMAAGSFNDNPKDELVISFSGGFIYRFDEKNNGFLGFKEGFLQCDPLTNAMIVLEKSNAAGRTIGNTSGRVERPEEIKGLAIYPNPVDNILHVNGLEKDTHFTIHSLEGKMITQGMATKEGIIDFSKLSKGFYLLTIENQSFKILKD